MENQKRHYSLGQDAKLGDQGRPIVGITTEHFYHRRCDIEQDLRCGPG